MNRFRDFNYEEHYILDAALMEILQQRGDKPDAKTVMALLNELNDQSLFRGRLPDGREGDVISLSDFGWGKIRLDDGKIVDFTEMDGPERIDREQRT